MSTLTSGRPKEEFCHSAESRKRAFQRYSFLPKYRKNRKRVFLQKWHFSAEIGSFCRSRALWNEEFCIKQDAGKEIYNCFSLNEVPCYPQNSSQAAERSNFCRKIDILPKESVSAEGQKDQINAERLSAEFLQKLSAEILQKDLSGRPLAKTDERHTMHQKFV